jgi:hypothetical protein
MLLLTPLTLYVWFIFGNGDARWRRARHSN